MKYFLDKNSSSKLRSVKLNREIIVAVVNPQIPPILI